MTTPRYTNRIALSAALMLLPLLITVAILPGCTHQAPALLSANNAATTVGYVGSAACAACHASECKLQSNSSHAHTVRRADTETLGSLAPPVGEIPGSPYSVVKKGDTGFRLVRTDRPEIGTDLEYAFGSGKAVSTYVGAIGKDTLTEIRMSYAPNSRKWYVTPSQVEVPDANTGRTYEMGLAKKCVLCHADKTDDKSAAPAEGSYGVGCESCHGPGRDHIAAVQSGSGSELKMQDSRKWGGERVNEVCGRCHRSFSAIPLTGADANNTARFQPYGLELSPCFQKSGDRLSCITCHDPHTDASTDLQHYDTICLTCHSGSKIPKHDDKTVTAATCKVNPTNGCVNCHMPKRAIFPGTHLPLQMSDHQIWAPRKK